MTIPTNITVKVTEAQLHRMVKESTAFSNYRELLDECRQGYTPTLDITDGNHIIIGAALAISGIHAFWRNERD